MTKILLNIIFGLSLLFCKLNAAEIGIKTEYTSGDNTIVQYQMVESVNDVWLIKSKHGKSDNAFNFIKENFKDNQHTATHLSHLGIIKLELNSDEQCLKIFDKLNDCKDIDYIVPDKIITVENTTPNDPQFLQQWDMFTIDMPQVWDFNIGNSDVVVAVIDTGIDYTHEDLIDNLYSDPVDGSHGWECFNGNLVKGGNDVYGHGTHCAGTIGAVSNNGIGVAGMNWNVKLQSFKFLGSGGSGTFSDAAILFNKIIDLKVNGGVNIRVTSNSWGGSGPPDKITIDALEAMSNAGILSIFAAGNSAANADITPFSPASAPNRGIITVMASDSADKKASFSNYGLGAVDIAAPGVSILSTMSTNTTLRLNNPTGYGLLSGTSMACPHVAGLAALLFSANDQLTVNEAKDIILNQNSYEPMADTAGKLSTTGGRINAYNTLTNPLVLTPVTNTYPTVFSTLVSGNQSGDLTSVSFTSSDPDNINLREFVYSVSTFEFNLNNPVPYTETNKVSFTLPSFIFDYTFFLSCGANDRNGGTDIKVNSFNVTKSPNFVLDDYGLNFDSTYSYNESSKIHYFTLLPTYSFTVNPNDPARINGAVSSRYSSNESYNGTSVGNPFVMGFIGLNTNSTYSTYVHTENNQHLIKKSPKKLHTLGTNAPVAFPDLIVQVDKTSGVAPLTVNYNLSETVSPNGSGKLAIFRPEDFSVPNSPVPMGSFVLKEPGIHKVKFFYSDALGYTDLYYIIFSVLKPTDPNPPPCIPVAITTQPVSKTVTVGDDVVFSVVAGGTAPFTYQWRFDGNNLNGQTNPSLSITDAQTSDNGIYDVVVVNACGQITSSPATLTVNVPPPPPPPTVILNPPTNLTVTQSGANLLVKWTDNSTGEDRYIVEVSVKRKGPWGGFVILPSLPANSTSYTYPLGGTAAMYRFRVQSAFENKFSLYSTVVNINPK